ncbi:MAG: glutamate--cysteine ligase [Pseudobdellovibrionaceae bacterium]|nr:glutamate--cysteine ligase [Bdellovibrionales bacterium]USN47008.1 MAG: glutamate--cysteine ligase [Pseudobdellovibrionaceae bacterium]
MVDQTIHKSIVAHRQQVSDWFREKKKGLAIPFYASFDIRDSGYKVAPVDANIFPAGFNNICQIDKDSSVEHAKQYFHDHYPSCGKRLLLLAEEHTKNPFYWENIRALRNLLTEAGFTVFMSWPKDFENAVEVESISGHNLTISPHEIRDGILFVEGEPIDLVINNNDFSVPYAEWVERVKTPINPPTALGWHRRRKDEFFDQYNLLAKEFAEIIDVDPWLLSVETQVFSDFDINSESSRETLANRVDQMIVDLEVVYKKHDISQKPYVFVKNSAGTYGLAVIHTLSGDDVRNWTYKARKKMKAAKGGGGVDQLIIQEGIPTAVRADDQSAEPAIYTLGCRLAGGFLRSHSEKGPGESLNSPGAVYKRLCVSDLNINIEGHPMENVYGWVAKLGVLAIGYEAKKAGVFFRDYTMEL